MIRFGLIGCGAIGKMRAEALQRTPGAELRMVYDVASERCGELASRFGAHAAASLHEVVASGEIDAVIVSTPPNLHREPCEAALSAQKEVLCEKPLAATVEDCQRIVDAARQHGRTLGIGYNYRFYPAIAKAREMIAAGRIGEVNYVNGFTGHPGGPEFTHQWVRNPEITGGGALMDNGTHVADLTLHFLGEVTESQGFTSARVWDFPGTEDNGFVLMRTRDGRIGTLHASWSEWRGYRFRVEICGTQGSIFASYPPMLTLHYDRPTGAAKRGQRHVYAFPAMQVKERLRSYRWTLVQSFVDEQLDFMERMAGRPGVGATGIDGLRAVELAYSAYNRTAVQTDAR
jgi:predicted dehydrogenase